MQLQIITCVNHRGLHQPCAYTFVTSSNLHPEEGLNILVETSTRFSAHFQAGTEESFTVHFRA